MPSQMNRKVIFLAVVAFSVLLVSIGYVALQNHYHQQRMTQQHLADFENRRNQIQSEYEKEMSQSKQLKEEALRNLKR